MLDFELSVSAVCWMHCVKCFVGDEDDDDFDPIAEGMRLDPEGHFLRKYVPEQSNYLTKHIHKPWEIPVIEQKITGCLIGVQYPNPIVEPSPYRASNLKKAKSLFYEKNIRKHF